MSVRNFEKWRNRQFVFLTNLHVLIFGSVLLPMDPSLTDQTKQESRTFLRERYLRLMAAINDQQADINMYGKTQVTGTLRAMDINIHSMQISNLETPIGVIPEATVRLGDIRTITIPEFKP